ncbi:MAG: hypothetical protein IK063_02460, partial [Clostridia bacterium]|nr:hypothetical protein [Clostridia bacterium]
YDDIINMPAPVSDYHPHMSMINRAAQFAPFAALTGYDNAIDETARTTGRKAELESGETEIINRKLNVLKEKSAMRPEIDIIYFIRDEYKDGGEYITVTGRFRKLDEYALFVFLENGTSIPVDDIYDISGNVFNDSGEQP